MSNVSHNNRFDRLITEMDPRDFNELHRIYQGHGQYYTTICREMAGRLFHWLFVLNTGGMSVSIYGYKQNSMVSYLPVIFLFGILLTYFSAKFEQWKFDKKGKKLDDNFDEFQNAKIKGQLFLDKIPPKTCLDKTPAILEVAGFFTFITGAIIGFISLS